MSRPNNAKIKVYYRDDGVQFLADDTEEKLFRWWLDSWSPDTWDSITEKQMEQRNYTARVLGHEVCDARTTIDLEEDNPPASSK